MKNLVYLAMLTLLLRADSALGAQPSEAVHSLGAPAAAVAVFDDYFAIQSALAQDSLENVAANAAAIANLVRQDSSGAFQLQLAVEAEALAATRDLKVARQVFKAVSGYLIQTYRSGKGPEGTIYEIHSPAVNVNWLQRDDTIRNPYLGKSCPHCGTFVN